MPPAPVNFSANDSNSAQNTTATFQAAGTYNIQATISNPAGESVTSSVQVMVTQTLTSIEVSPSMVSVNAGSTQAFTAVGYDQFGTTLTTQPTFTWTTSAQGHSIRMATSRLRQPVAQARSRRAAARSTALPA